jgi:hypothetical protein
MFLLVYFIYCRFTQQSMEMHKRKAVESSQTAADLKLHLDKYQIYDRLFYYLITMQR